MVNVNGDLVTPNLYVNVYIMRPVGLTLGGYDEVGFGGCDGSRNECTWNWISLRG